MLPRHFINVTGRSDQLVYRELPFDVPPVHVDGLWHRRQNQRPEHAWLRQALATAAREGFDEGVR